MDFELRSAHQKLEMEQRERKEVARLRIEREKKAKAARQREAIEAAQRIRRIDEARTSHSNTIRAAMPNSWNLPFNWFSWLATHNSFMILESKSGCSWWNLLMPTN